MVNRWMWILMVIIFHYCKYVCSRALQESMINPEENIGVNEYLSEGDIRISRRRNAVRDFSQTWVNRTVPYTVEKLSDTEHQQVVMAMQELSAKSCVRFVPRTIQRDYITIVKLDGCSSSVGRRGGQQQVILGDGCYEKGTIMHELMHALGFWHEHSRPDRDDFIQIIWSNIAQEHKSNFERYDQSAIDTLNTVYDYGSIMHYKNNTFAMDRSKITINATLPLPPGVEMGQRVMLSDTDIVRLSRLYRCNITHCSDPNVPKNGVRVGENFQVASSVYYSCNKGYVLFGSSGRFCLDLGLWSGNLPSCLPESPTGDPIHYCSYDNHSLCGWMQDLTAQRNWTFINRSTPSNGTGPVEDHTMGSPEGWYIYLETSSPTNSGDKARIISPVYTFSSKACMIFYYCMYGQDLGSLNVYQQYNESRSLIFSISGDKGPDWRLVHLTLDDMAKFVIVLEATAGNSYMADIAVDDVVVGPCLSLQELSADAVADTLRCSFDDGICDWYQDLRDIFNWTLNGNRTATLRTGPSCDPVDCLTGKYLYIESSQPRVMGDFARIVTPLLHGDGGRCLLFYYNMYGESIGTLNVKVRLPGGNELLLWTKSGNQGQNWFYEKVDFDAPNYYKLVFEGKVGSSYTGDIAIDSVEVVFGECKDNVRYDCSFEHDMCGWQNTSDDQRDWQRIQGSTPTPDTGPATDHTGNNGYYLYVESSRTRPHDKARLTSAVVSGWFPGYCLRVWYHMYGQDIGTLRLLTRTCSTGVETVVWQTSGNLGNIWRKKVVFLTSPGQDFKIIFEVELTGSPSGLGDIAIDDIYLHAGLCET